MCSKILIKQALHLIDNWLDFQTYIKEIPGVAVGISVEDETVFKREYGYADLENKIKLNGWHLFRIASHSKLFTATAIMKLYHEGKLSIDDRVSKYLPWFASEKDKNLQDIRIFHLLTHSSGITADGNTAHWITYKFPSIEEIKEQVIEGISYFKVSEIHKYSNFGYTLLGQIIENVSGLSYHAYIKKEILEPLKMNKTVTDVNESNITKHAIGYGVKYPGKERDKLEHAPAKVMCPATGLSSTVEDLIKFYQAHFLGNNILFPDYIKREMQRTQFKSKGVDRGLGFAIANLPDIQLVGHGGTYPGFATQSQFIQDKKMIVVVLINAIDAQPGSVLKGIINILLFVTKQKGKLLAKPDKQMQDLKDLVGFYKSDWGVGLFSQIGSKLVLTAPGADNPAGSLTTLEHIEGYKFTVPKEPASVKSGQVIDFIDGPDGEKIYVDNHGGKRKKFKFSY
ncbi:MAG: serine hydrolase domain-containing protein [Promethearchaeota archaeon]